MSHEHEDDTQPILRTSPARMIRGIAVVGITLAIAGTILMFTFHDMVANPPPVALMEKPATPPPPPAAAGVTQVTILAGASVQGSKSFDPDEVKVPLGNKVVWINSDTAIHTATSGTGATDAASGKVFDTTFINPGEKSKELEIKGAKVGDTIPYYCQVHPFMTGKVTIVEAAAGGSGAGGAPAAASGPTVHILAGSSVQGSKAYDPTPVDIKKGDKLTVVNDDSAMHTVTSGTGPEDANSGKAFDSSLIDAGKTVTVDTSALDAGAYDFHCMVHPFMKGKLNVS